MREDRRKGGQTWAVVDFPIGGGDGAEGIVPENPVAARGFTGSVPGSVQ